MIADLVLDAQRHFRGILLWLCALVLFAVWIRHRTAYRLAASSVAKNAAARSFFASAAARSGGTVARLPASYAASQRPSAFARAISARPDGCIAPAATSASAFSRLIFDHRLRAARGVNFCSHQDASSARLGPSIHPHASAISTASGYVTDACPAPFFASFSQRPREVA